MLITLVVFTTINYKHIIKYVKIGLFIYQFSVLDSIGFTRFFNSVG